MKVIEAKEGNAILIWLAEHNYGFSEKDREVFDDYVRRGWCFVTARVDLQKAGMMGLINDEGLVNSLAMMFESNKPVYPLALTGTIGSEVEVLLYVFDTHKIRDASDRFALKYAGEREMKYLRDRVLFEPGASVIEWDFEQSYLTKLKAKLKPEQMKEDLVLDRAPDNEPYREHVYRW